ncbi:hypothetical protein E8E11_002223 [Didymella keratinophila]|nr:hypothetical protein E8E11_002223 [Didymella keratinophila]
MARKESLQSIREWMSASFPDEFLKFDTYIRGVRFTLLQFYIQLSNGPNADKANTVQVGLTLGDSTPIYAWTKSGMVSIGHEAETGKIQPQGDFSSPQIKFSEPFCWLEPTENEAGLARFEALVRYLVWTHNAPNAAMKHRLDIFKEHLPGACRDVAEQLVKRVAQTPTQTPSRTRIQTPGRIPARMPFEENANIPIATPTRPSIAPQTPRILRSSTQVVPQQPSTPTAPNLVSDQLHRIADAALLSVRAQLLAQIGLAQQGSVRETEEFQSKIRDLELELIDAEIERKKLGTESTELKVQIRELEAKVLSANRDNERLEQKAAELKATIRELGSTLKGADKDKKRAEKETFDYKAIVRDLEAKLIGAEAVKKDAEHEINELKTKIRNLKSSSEAADKDKKKVEKTVIELGAKNRELDARLKGAETHKKNTEEEANELKAKMGDLETKLQGAKKEKKSIEKKVADLGEKVADAEARAKEAERQMAVWKARFAAQKKEMLDVCMKEE